MTTKPQKKNIWQDHYTRQAKKEQYPARSVFKLQEIQEKLNILKPGQRVLDLGCSPGSWLLYAAKVVGEKGRVFGIDLKPVTEKLPSNAEAHVGDIFDEAAAYWARIGTGFHMVMSDMAPNTTGDTTVDAARSFRLCEAAMEVAARHLVPGGTFVCKIFQGEDFETMVAAVKHRFGKHKIFKPQSCRKASKEIYIIGTDLKKEASRNVGA